MKLMKMVAMAFVMILTATGCSSDMESPEDLAHIPIYSEEKKSIYDGIDKLLLNSYLTIPSNSKEVGKINEVDLDNDGINEIVAFEKTESEDSEVGFMVLGQNEDYKDSITYTEIGTILEKGESIEYANFYDLDNDGDKEIILLIKNKEKTNMHIYRSKDGEISKLYTLNPSWLPNEENLTSMKIKIGYVDDDPKIDIVMLHFDATKNEMYASITNFNKHITLKDYVKIENVKNLNDLYISIANVAPSKRGVVLDIPTAKENNYITQILYMEESKLYKAFSDSDRSIMKAYYIPVEDINKDKVVDIPIVNGNSHSYTSKTSANVSWHVWNGKSGEESRLLFTIQKYYNYQYNYQLLIPNNLVNKINIKQEYNKDSVEFKFSYYDSEGMQSKDLFTIAVLNKSITDENKNMTAKTGTILGESEENTFVLYLNDIEELEKLDITAESLLEWFSLIY